jgi:hypothetical protein
LCGNDNDGPLSEQNINNPTSATGHISMQAKRVGNKRRDKNWSCKRVQDKKQQEEVNRETSNEATCIDAPHFNAFTTTTTTTTNICKENPLSHHKGPKRHIPHYLNTMQYNQQVDAPTSPHSLSSLESLDDGDDDELRQLDALDLQREQHDLANVQNAIIDQDTSNPNSNAHYQDANIQEVEEKGPLQMNKMQANNVQDLSNVADAIQNVRHYKTIQENTLHEEHHALDKEQHLFHTNHQNTVSMNQHGMNRHHQYGSLLHHGNNMAHLDNTLRQGISGSDAHAAYWKKYLANKEEKKKKTTTERGIPFSLDMIAPMDSL